MAALNGRVAPEHISKKILALPWVKSGSEGERIVGDTCDTGETAGSVDCLSSEKGSLGVSQGETVLGSV